MSCVTVTTLDPVERAAARSVAADALCVLYDEAEAIADETGVLVCPSLDVEVEVVLDALVEAGYRILAPEPSEASSELPV